MVMSTLNAKEVTILAQICASMTIDLYQHSLLGMLTLSPKVLKKCSEKPFIKQYKNMCILIK